MDTARLPRRALPAPRMAAGTFARDPQPGRITWGAFLTRFPQGLCGQLTARRALNPSIKARRLRGGDACHPGTTMPLSRRSCGAVPSRETPKNERRIIRAPPQTIAESARLKTAKC